MSSIQVLRCYGGRGALGLKNGRSPGRLHGIARWSLSHPKGWTLTGMEGVTIRTEVLVINSRFLKYLSWFLWTLQCFSSSKNRFVSFFFNRTLGRPVSLEAGKLLPPPNQKCCNSRDNIDETSREYGGDETEKGRKSWVRRTYAGLWSGEEGPKGLIRRLTCQYHHRPSKILYYLHRTI